MRFDPVPDGVVRQTKGAPAYLARYRTHAGHYETEAVAYIDNDED